MKIAIEAQRIFRKKKHGMDIVALELIRKLQKIDHRNEYYILVKKDEDHKALEETGNFHIVELPDAPYPLWEQYYLPKAVKKIAPDLLHCTSNTAPLKVSASLVITLHDIIYMHKANLVNRSLYQRFGNLYRKWLIPKIVHNCQAIITVSNFEKNKIEQYFDFPKGRVRTVYNAFNSRFAPIGNPEILHKYQIKYKLPKEYILFLGNTDPKKNMSTVLKAMSLLHRSKSINIPLVMPDVNETFLQSMLKETGDSSLRESIFLTGYVPNDELVYLYNSAKIFLYPSFYESFGIPMLEAMSCGVPVVVSNRAAMPEVAGGAALLVDPEDEEDIAHAIVRLISDETLYQSCKSAGLKRAASFNWTLTAFGVLETYNKIFQHTLANQLQFTA